MPSRSRTIGLLLILPVAVQLSGCATGTGAAPAGGAPPPAGGAPPPAPTGGITMAQRAQGALEGLFMGTIIGMQGGLIGAAIGGTTMLVVGAITGRSPIGAGGGGGGGGGY